MFTVLRAIKACVIFLPYGRFKKSPQARLALRALEDLLIIFLHANWRLPGRISKKYDMQKLLQITQEIRRGVSLFHREECALVLFIHVGKCHTYINHI